jgi:hypothetical protein
MALLFLVLLLSTFGGTIIIHFLKNFLLKENANLSLDWDGLLERLCLTYIVYGAINFWLLIPVIIALKVAYRFYILGSLPGLGQTKEPAASSQKVLLKSELAFDLLASPAFALLVGVLFK